MCRWLSAPFRHQSQRKERGPTSVRDIISLTPVRTRMHPIQTKLYSPAFRQRSKAEKVSVPNTSIQVNSIYFEHDIAIDSIILSESR